MTTGAEVDFGGQISSADPACDGLEEFVRLRRRTLGESEFTNFKSTLTDANGRFEFNGVEIVNSAEYVAVAPHHDECDDATSSAVRVLARGKVLVRVNDKTPKRGTLIRIKGAVRPRHRNSNVRLQQHRGGGWETVLGDRLDGRSRFSFEFEAVGPKTQRYRVHWVGADDNEPATSKEIKLKLHK